MLDTGVTIETDEKDQKWYIIERHDPIPLLWC